LEQGALVLGRFGHRVVDAMLAAGFHVGGDGFDPLATKILNQSGMRVAIEQEAARLHPDDCR
jgi:hypothetical protein